ncbi:MAG: glycoside hydrolase family 32 protein [Leptolyngbyaceae cyanobacterium]
MTLETIATQHIQSLAFDVANDPLRPIYHIAAPANWMNDPHGAIFHEDWYHLFYQTNPYGSNWGFISWGHVASQDGVHWEHRPLALVPTSDSPDEHGVFSGCCVNFPQDGADPETCQPTIFYTGLRRRQIPHRDVNLSEQSQLMATSVDSSLNTWEKCDRPIITAPSHPNWREGIDESMDNLDCMRDPFVWQDVNGRWYLLLGTALRSSENSSRVEGNALLYHYQDNEWRSLGQFVQTSHGRNWECCNYLRLDQGTDGAEKAEILIISPEYCKYDPHNPRAKEKKFVLWTTGSLNLPPATGQADQLTAQPTAQPTAQSNGYFSPQTDETGEIWRVLDYGGSDGFYAATTLQHEGKTTLWGWSIGGGQPQSAWNGVLTLPRQLEWRDNDLSMSPMSWVEELRGARLYHNFNFSVGGGQSEAYPLAIGDCVEIKAEIGIEEGDGVTFSMWGDGVKVTLHRQRRSITITDKDQSYEVPLKPQIDLENCVIRCFLDRSILEVFLDDVQVLTRRVYPKDINQKAIAIYGANSGDRVHVSEIQVWRMNTIWLNE